MSLYTVECGEVDGSTVLDFHGELDLSVSEEVEALMVRMLSLGPTVVDLSRCEYIDSTVLTTFVRMTARFYELFPLVISPSGAIRRIFEITGLGSALPVFADRIAALQ